MKRIILLSLAIIIAISSCSKTETSVITGSDADILSCIVHTGILSLEAPITGNVIEANLPAEAKDWPISVDFVLSEQAGISPAPETVTEWMDENIFTVTSANGETSKQYTLLINYVKDNVSSK